MAEILTNVTPTKSWWQKTSTWIIIIVVVLVAMVYPFIGEDAKPVASAKPSPQVSVGAVASTQDATVNELRGLVKKHDVNRANSEAVQVEILAKLKEIDARLQAIEKCACKKPKVKAKSKAKPKASPKLVVNPAPPVAPSVYEPPKSCCEFSQPKPAIIKPGHMPLGALPSARCPNCQGEGK